jgi:hypothetical protein
MAARIQVFARRIPYIAIIYFENIDAVSSLPYEGRRAGARSGFGEPTPDRQRKLETGGFAS